MIMRKNLPRHCSHLHPKITWINCRWNWISSTFNVFGCNFLTDRALITFYSLFYCRNILKKNYCPNRTYTRQAQKTQIINERGNSLGGSKQIEGVWCSRMCKIMSIYYVSLLFQDLRISQSWKESQNNLFLTVGIILT